MPPPPTAESAPGSDYAPWRRRLHEVIFEADTPGGHLFDLVLLVAIVASVAVVSLETVEEIERAAAWSGGPTYGAVFRVLEWIFTLAFTVEYVLRLLAVRRPLAYARSFFGIVDLLSILPTYLAVMVPHAQSMLVIRILRLLRVFRVLKLARMVSEGANLRKAVWGSRGKITVFLLTVLTIVSILGAAMYLIESRHNEGFDSIPQSMYWAIVTLTTVGYGDVAPVTPLGKMVSVTIMILGYSMIIVPTGILSAELVARPQAVSSAHCPSCAREGHAVDATFCKWCGEKL